MAPTQALEAQNPFEKKVVFAVCFGNSTVQMVLCKFTLWRGEQFFVLVFNRLPQIKTIIFLLKWRSFAERVQIHKTHLRLS